MSTDEPPIDLKAPLEYAEHNLLQVLLDRFKLSSHSTGVHLELTFDADTPAIWTRKAKPSLMRGLDEGKMAEYQQRLDSIFHEDGGAWRFDDPDFPFRYSNGGTLPIMDVGGSKYACLFYRESKPIGWNIANGASDSVAELLYPQSTIERELQEELIVISPGNKRRYSFRSGASPYRLPDFELALRSWSAELGLELTKFEDASLDVKWVAGGDSVKIVDPQGRSFVHSGFFLNINATDHGIEFDSVAEFRCPANDVVLLDGEIHSGLNLGRPVGLFEIDRLRDLDTCHCFLPDAIYFEGRKYDVRGEDELVRFIDEEFIDALKDKGLWGKVEHKKWRDAQDKLDLCPVTRSILKRYHREVERPAPVAACFISYSTKDTDFVNVLFRRLQEAGVRVWFAPEDLRGLGRVWPQIQDAIRTHDSFVLVISDSAMASKWVADETREVKQREREEGRPILIPIRLTPYENVEKWTSRIDVDGEDMAKDIRESHIRDFSGWEDERVFDESITQLLEDIHEACEQGRAYRAITR